MVLRAATKDENVPRPRTSVMVGAALDADLEGAVQKGRSVRHAPQIAADSSS